MHGWFSYRNGCLFGQLIFSLHLISHSSLQLFVMSIDLVSSSTYKPRNPHSNSPLLSYFWAAFACWPTKYINRTSTKVRSARCSHPSECPKIASIRNVRCSHPSWPFPLTINQVLIFQVLITTSVSKYFILQILTVNEALVYWIFLWPFSHTVNQVHNNEYLQSMKHSCAEYSSIMTLSTYTLPAFPCQTGCLYIDFKFSLTPLLPSLVRRAVCTLTPIFHLHPSCLPLSDGLSVHWLQVTAQRPHAHHHQHPGQDQVPAHGYE